MGCIYNQITPTQLKLQRCYFIPGQLKRQIDKRRSIAVFIGIQICLESAIRMRLLLKLKFDKAAS